MPTSRSSLPAVRAVRARLVAAAAAAFALVAMLIVPASPAAAAGGPAGEVFAMVNQQRASNGLPPLVSDPVLDNAAYQWANYLRAYGLFEHSSSAWRDSMIGGSGWVYSGENIAAGYTSAASVMNGWMNSAGHRANILGRNYVGMGVAYITGGPWGTYWVQIFAGSLPRVSPGTAPVVTGSPAVGATLSATTSGWPSGTSIGWSWQSDGQAIPGATGPNYVPSISDQGRRITATASGWKPGLYTSYTISSPTSTVTGGATSERLSGANRYDAAVSMSRAGFSPGVPVVYVASGATFPDALSAAPAASLLGGPLLLTPGDQLPSGVATELRRLAPARIVVAGGPASVSPAVFSALQEIAPTTRLGGADRYEASRAIIRDAFGSATVAYVATGLNFPDALTASAAAARVDGPVVLVNGLQQTVDAPTLELLRDLGVTTVRIAGGPASVTPAIQSHLQREGFAVERFSGADRFEAGMNVSVNAFPSASTVYLASGYTFPDALAGAALAGSSDAPLFLAATTCIPESVGRAITALGATRVVILGGPATLSASVASFQRC